MTAHATSPTPASVAARVAAIPHLSMDDLWALWDDHFEDRPNHHHRVWLRRLMIDIEAGKIDTVVVYKIDRLTRESAGLRQAGRRVRPQRRLLRLGHASERATV